ncbi:MAG TPA: biopolymer transporter ExbD [Burkholderiales bacterium]|nr:biopolymer transporter ExbD [Burkholderiales bacterium]
MNFQRGQAREELEINLVPLIDVLLVILIFLMVTTTYSKFAELEINLPEAAAEKQAERPNEISVGVDAQGGYSVNRKAVAAGGDALIQELRRAAGDRANPVIVINADAKATHQSVIRVMEAARAAGYHHITFTVLQTGG